MASTEHSTEQVMATCDTRTNNSETAIIPYCFLDKLHIPYSFIPQVFSEHLFCIRPHAICNGKSNFDYSYL